MAPFTGSVLDLLRAAQMTGPSWEAGWWPFWKAVDALPKTARDLAVIEQHTGLTSEQLPTIPVAETYGAIGRGAGKTLNISLKGLHAAIAFDAAHIRPGELVVVPLIFADRKQARQAVGYLRGFCQLPQVRPFVSRTIKEVVELKTGVNIEIMTASVSSVRGYTCPAAICEEVCFWQGTSPDSANPDSEIVNALRPALARVPGSQLFVVSSPYAQEGILFDAFERGFSKPDPEVLHWNASTLAMHPAGEDRAGRELRRAIDRMWQRDPAKAAAEYGRDGRVQFRVSTAAAFLSPAQVDAVIDEGVRERRPDLSVKYQAFVDVSLGRRDSWALAIGHLDEETGTAVLDLLRERRPPLDIAATITEWADLLIDHGITEVTGDRVAGEFNRAAWAEAGFPYLVATLPKDQLYVEFLSAVNTERVLLLDDPTGLRAQLLALQRRPRAGGIDKIEEPRGQHDDLANVCAGVCCQLLGVGQPDRPKRRLKVRIGP